MLLIQSCVTGSHICFNNRTLPYFGEFRSGPKKLHLLCQTSEAFRILQSLGHLADALAAQSQSDTNLLKISLVRCLWDYMITCLIRYGSVSQLLNIIVSYFSVCYNFNKELAIKIVYTLGKHTNDNIHKLLVILALPDYVYLDINWPRYKAAS